MKYLSILSMLLLSGCSSQSFKDKATDQIFEQVTGKEYSRNAAQCSSVKRQCTDGQYEEWTQENGQKACACN
ncbi:hypothetical protein [Alteromonas genovensis]|uniref:hypothetical protein n=2 Tax=Alteromonas TaxID=226 RepID=UPI000AA4BF15